MIIFRSINWANFLSTGNIPTKVILDSHPTTLIVGDNGAGKSTLLDALSFGLYGKAFRDVNKPQLVNSITKKNLLVELEFEVNRNKYKIIRGIKPSVFEIYADGKLLNQDAATKDYQDYLEKNILKLNHKSFIQIVVLGSANFTPFMQLKPNERREVIEDILDIQIFSKMFVLLKEKIQANKTNLTENKYSIQNVDNLIVAQNKHINEIKSLKKSDSEGRRKKLEELDAEIEKHNQEKRLYAIKIETLSEKIVSLEPEKEKKRRLDDILHTIRHKVDALTKSIKFFVDNDDCPTCQRKIDDEFKNNIINEKTVELDTVSDGQTKLKEKIDGVSSKIADMKVISTSIDTIRALISTENVRIQSLEKQKTNLNNELDVVVVTDVGYIEELNRLEKVKTDLEVVSTKLNKERSSLDQAYILLKDTGIKSKIIKQYVPMINKLIQKYLSEMDFFVNFELDETFKEKIESRYHDEFAYSSFSEGEKLRIDLALMFTWRAISKIRSSSTTNLLIMDEVFDSSLDSAGTEDFMKIIEAMDNTNIFIISHKGHLSDKFDNQISFEKYKGFSRCVMNN